MTVVITGATGHIGANLVRRLVDRGRRTRCLVHINTRSIDGLDVESVSGDVRDFESLCRAFRGAEVVYHLAASISITTDNWASLEAINVKGTRNVIQACLHTGVRRLVHFSSIHALEQELHAVAVDETCSRVDDSRRCPPYDRSKAAGERELQQGIEKGLDAITIIPTAVFGPNDFYPSYFGEALLAMAQNRIPMLVKGGYNWVDVRDVVSGAICAEEIAPTGAQYILSGHWVSMCDIANMVSGITGVPGNKPVCPLWLARIGVPLIKSLSQLRGKRPLYTSVSLRSLRSNRNISHEKATRELGYQPRPFRESLVDTLAWFEENGYLNGRQNTNTVESR